MPQGTRGMWARAVYSGLGALFCLGVVGCMGTEKDRITPPRIGTGNTGKAVQPGLPGTPILPGSSGSATRQTTTSPPASSNPYNGLGNGGIQQTGGFTQGTATSATSRGFVPPAASPTPSPVIPPVGPGATPPSAGFGGMPAPAMDYPNSQGRGASFNPPAPDLSNLGPIPPSPPGTVATASNFSPIVPPQVPPVPGSQTVNFGVGQFGGQ
jgi:hypothetical protein